ncbi:helix-turn-helix domain-containing protein [Hansschlegelia quercus]|uniref:XRE family transcriptional regulator n=1 Tax=Hansschlegelia quercus TaxID=2528245 RepID=A0A4V2JDX9_9HYPH|nr:XRE family transcriptional regulator [Hansschlegelia quercus]TBN52509.1 XRE family transcriptional regulator [Hansschlegelia quercus]
MNEAEFVAAFSRELKSLRLSNGMTLEELSRASEVSISTISKIENLQQKPSFETALRVARALKVNFVQMMEGPGLPQSGMTRRTITRAGEADTFRSDYYTYGVHATEIARKIMVPLVMRIRNRTPPPLADWSIHDGEEFVYVMKGVLEFHSEQYSPAILNVGDSCYFDSTMRHAFVSKGDGDAEILSICLSIKPFEEQARHSGDRSVQDGV